jgi:hypothetical protein
MGVGEAVGAEIGSGDGCPEGCEGDETFWQLVRAAATIKAIKRVRRCNISDISLSKSGKVDDARHRDGFHIKTHQHRSTKVIF